MKKKVILFAPNIENGGIEKNIVSLGNYFISQNSAPPAPPAPPAPQSASSASSDSSASSAAPPRPKPFRRRQTTGRTYPVCRFYGTRNGCRNGDSCRFQHLDN